MDFEWSENKNRINIKKHGISFYDAQQAFLDPKRIIAEDLKHSENEQRFICIGKVNDGIATVRFTYRENKIRIFGAGYWRKFRRLYEKQD